LTELIQVTNQRNHELYAGSTPPIDKAPVSVKRKHREVEKHSSHFTLLFGSCLSLSEDLKAKGR
jgi:hypothetical protein